VLVADFAIVVAVAIVQTCLAQLLSTVAARDTSSRRAEMATKLSAVWSIAISAFGTFRTWCDVRLESVMRTKADVRRPLQIYRFTPWLAGSSALGLSVFCRL
jgi:hypothetical protein